MKSINRILICAIAFLLAFSCSKKETYSPGEADEAGCYGVYFPAQEISGAFEPADVKKFDVTVTRTVEKGAIEVPVVIEGSGADYVSFPSVKFADGQKEVVVTGTVSDTIPQNKEFDVTISIADAKYVSKYSSNPSYIAFTVVVESWKYLGKGLFWDLWLENDSFEVDFYQNQGDASKYRVVNPYKAFWDKYGEAYEKGGWVLSEYTDKLEFRVLEPGDVLFEGTDYETKITRENLIYYDSFPFGLNHPTYGADIIAYHPAEFSSYAGDDKNFIYNKVDNWQDPDAEGNVIPSVVYMAAERYMDGIGGWGGSQSTDEAVVLQFPGGVFVDYTVSIETGTTVEGEMPVAFETGKDVEAVDFCIYEGELTSKEIRSKKALIAAGEEPDAQELDMETKAFTFSADTTAIFTIIAVSYDKYGNDQSDCDATFGYVKKGDERPVTAGCSLNLPSEAYIAAGYKTNNSLMFNIYGKDIKSAGVQIVTSKAYKTDPDSCWTLVKEVSDDVVESLNEAGGFTSIMTDLKPNTEYVFLYYAFNGYQEYKGTAVCSTEGLPLQLVKEGIYHARAFFEYDQDGAQLFFDPNSETQDEYSLQNFGLGELLFKWDTATDTIRPITPQLLEYADEEVGSIIVGEVLEMMYALYGEEAEDAIAFYESQGMEITSIAGTSSYCAEADTMRFALCYYSSVGYIGTGVESFVVTGTPDGGVSFTALSAGTPEIKWFSSPFSVSGKVNFSRIDRNAPQFERTVKSARYTKGTVNTPVDVSSLRMQKRLSGELQTIK